MPIQQSHRLKALGMIQKMQLYVETFSRSYFKDLRDRNTVWKLKKKNNF